MFHLEISLPVLPFTSLREVLTGLFLQTHVPAILLPLPWSAVPVEPLTALTEGTDPGRRATSSEPSPPPTDGNARTFTSAAIPASSPLIKQHRKPSVPLSLSVTSQPSTQRIQALRSPLLCLIQLRVSPGPTVIKPRLC